MRLYSHKDVDKKALRGARIAGQQPSDVDDGYGGCLHRARKVAPAADSRVDISAIAA